MTLFRFTNAFTILMAVSMALPALAQQNPAGLAAPNTAKVQDAMSLLPPRESIPGGLLGDRFSRSEKNRLLHVDEDELLAGFRHRPGKQAWIGEHVGKWLHAATLTWANTGDPDLKEKLDRVAGELMKCQEPDGYLGTYIPGKRFGLYPDADWDVWVHKYDLLGLLTYYQFTGSKSALSCCRRIGDLLVNTFGPGKKSINSAGTHEGMASGSVLEPIVLLYRSTADARYLEFARYIVNAWEEPKGPHVVSSLIRLRSVRQTANAKAYEMLSDLNGLCELYRATGEQRYLDPVLAAWDDIVKNRLYITGSGSSYEHWQDEYHLPNGTSADICETCVTVTWEQLNLQLLRLTGNSQYADQLERSVYNHLLGAQKPTGDAWCYYTPLQGVKPYSPQTTCCLSSGPRGIALLPTFIYATTGRGVAVNLFTPSRATATVPGVGAVRLEQQTQYPLDGRVTLFVSPAAGPCTFQVSLRVPAWSPKTSITVNGRPVQTSPGQGGYASIKRMWKAGDRVTYTIAIPTRVVLGDHENEGKAAVMVGPLVLAADEEHNAGHKAMWRMSLAADEINRLGFRRVTEGSEDGEPVFEAACLSSAPAQPGSTVSAKSTIKLVPFYAAGQNGSRFAVWLQRAGKVPADASLLGLGRESRSRDGNQPGSINDGDPSTFVVTWDNSPQPEAWFAVDLDQPQSISRVVFAHGRCFHDGGWFDTSGGKPRVQIRRAKDGPWEDAATLDGYPACTAEKPSAALRDGARFTARFAAVTVWGLRVIGKPASGDSAMQAFSSCGELEAFGGG